MTDVLVVGGGPTGMMAAGELALAGVDVAIVERRTTAELVGSRAGGIHSRTIEILDQRGIADRFLAAGRTAQTARFAGTVLDISDFPTRHPYGLALWQDRMAPILADWIEQLGVPVSRGRQVTGLVQDESGVEARLADGGTMHAAYLVGADGGRSVIRRAAGIDFPGWEATRSNLIAEVEVAEEPPSGMRQDERGVHGLALLEDGRTYRVITTEQRLGPATEPTLADLGAALTAVYGTDFGVHDARWISRFTDATRQAAAYRSGRVLLAGDAAHIHYPAGGQGIGLGIQDAVNLGWKLARVVTGTAPDSLLDTYHAERHPAGARALRHSMAQTVLQRHDPRTVALGEAVDGLMAMDQPRRQVAALIHGLDVAYDLGEGHPLLGRRMPDADLDTAEGRTTAFTLLHRAQAILLVLAPGWTFDTTAWTGRLRLVHATSAGPLDLPVVGRVSTPSAVLIRPDGHVGWVGEGSDLGLADALTRWLGPPAPGGARGGAPLG